MSDKYAALKSRIEKALEDLTNGRASMHVPVLDTDVDLVLYDCLELLAERDADNRRIAELEARTLTVKLPPVIRIDGPHVSFNAYGQSGIQNALYESCAAAGISLKIEGE